MSLMEMIQTMNLKTLIESITSTTEKMFYMKVLYKRHHSMLASGIISLGFFQGPPELSSSLYIWTNFIVCKSKLSTLLSDSLLPSALSLPPSEISLFSVPDNYCIKTSVPSVFQKFHPSSAESLLQADNYQQLPIISVLSICTTLYGLCFLTSSCREMFCSCCFPRPLSKVTRNLLVTPLGVFVTGLILMFLCSIFHCQQASSQGSCLSFTTPLSPIQCIFLFLLHVVSFLCCSKIHSQLFSPSYFTQQSHAFLVASVV